jgi:hypothetical protein
MLEGIDAQRAVEGAQRAGARLDALRPEQVWLEPGADPGVGDEEEELRLHAATGPFWDEVTGEALPADLVRAAREEEIKFMVSWQVWDDAATGECWRTLGRKPLAGKWVDVNKGDAQRPVVRSRYVAKEFADRKSDEFYAPTPPLESLRLLLSHVASDRCSGRGGRKLMVIDARKAHLHAEVDRVVYVELPPEIRRPGRCGRLRRCLYGTRDAPARWEAHLADELKKMGFLQGRASPCCFVHAHRDLRCVVHGDDFVFAGPDPDLSWVQKAMEASFLTKLVGKLGGDAGDSQEVRVLNRVIAWGPKGISYEADPRHHEILVRSLVGDKRPLRTPGAPDTGKAGRLGRFEEVEEVKKVCGAGEEEEADEKLDEKRTGLFRSGAARANYLSLDRTAISFAAKELCRRMSSPTKGALAALQRLARYLAGAPRLVYTFPWQPAPEVLTIYADSDFAGCRATRKSTSGGCALRGCHLIKHWAPTQKQITLSSGEAELGSVVQGLREGFGLRSIAADLGLAARVHLCTDSSAAQGICRRAGIGKVRHLATPQLWAQEKLRNKEFDLFKVAGENNPADAMTKHLERSVLDRHLRFMGLLRASGRPAAAPQLAAEVDSTLAA